MQDQDYFDTSRRIIHIDMDAFYASIEQRDRKDLRGRPVIVGGDPQKRGVVATCSYEARRFGVHSAMASRTALKLCPDAVFLAPRFDVYRQVSSEIMQVFFEYTDLVEPVSLDEAYLNVTYNKKNLSVMQAARAIKRDIWEKTQLTASAGVAVNKLLAKIASDLNKPDGLTVITPRETRALLDTLPIRKFAGVGKATEMRLNALGILTGADLYQLSEDRLRQLFHKQGSLLYHSVRGEDSRPVQPERVRKSIGKETTFERDLESARWDLARPHLASLAEQVIQRMRDLGYLGAMSLTLKIKWADFQLTTRTLTAPKPIQDTPTLLGFLPTLLEHAGSPGKAVRLLGVSVSNLQHQEKASGEGAVVALSLWD